MGCGRPQAPPLMGSWLCKYWHMSRSGCYQGKIVLEQEEREREISTKHWIQDNLFTPPTSQLRSGP